MSEHQSLDHADSAGNVSAPPSVSVDTLRQRILDAAREAFFERGYPEATVEDIASRAGVPPEQAEAVVGGARGALVALMDIAMYGDDSPLTFLERPRAQQVRQEPDQRVQLRTLAHGVSDMLDRVGPLYLGLRYAAHTDNEIAEAYTNLHDAGRRNMGIIAGWIAANGPLKAGMSEDLAADVLWTLTSADVHHLLRYHREWPEEQYREWLATTLIESLLP